MSEWLPAYHLPPGEVRSGTNDQVPESNVMDGTTLPHLGDLFAGTPCPWCNTLQAWPLENGCQNCAANSMVDSLSSRAQISSYAPSGFESYPATGYTPPMPTFTPANPFSTLSDQPTFPIYWISENDIQHNTLRAILSWWFPGQASCGWKWNEETVSWGFYVAVPQALPEEYTRLWKLQPISSFVTWLQNDTVTVYRNEKDRSDLNVRYTAGSGSVGYGTPYTFDSLHGQAGGAWVTPHHMSASKKRRRRIVGATTSITDATRKRPVPDAEAYLLARSCRDPRHKSELDFTPDKDCNGCANIGQKENERLRSPRFRQVRKSRREMRMRRRENNELKASGAAFDQWGPTSISVHNQEWPMMMLAPQEPGPDMVDNYTVTMPNGPPRDYPERPPRPPRPALEG